MAFVQLGADNKVLQESIQSKLEAAKKEPCDAKLYDFDEVNYRIFIDPDNRKEMRVSLSASSWKECKSKGSESWIKEKLGEFVTDVNDDGVNFKIPLDDEKTQSKAASIAQTFGKLRVYALGGPLYDYCKALQENKPKKETFDFNFRPDTHCWIRPQSDRVTVVLGMEFAVDTDRIIANQILTEFIEVRRQRDVQKAPVISYSKDPPMELKGLKLPSFNKAKFLGYFSILLLQTHVNKNKLDVTIENVVGFRAYLTYHIKCAKAYFHQSMRARVKSLLQILNRARYEPDESRKKKKIIVGAK